MIEFRNFIVNATTESKTKINHQLVNFVTYWKNL
ncbi:hypothetical protein BPO_p0007 (plasmid) [Bergeyella porcorum]|uniref:Uncharacterized protein n=1 Tax=Bergeyella porcorum TaxID=1735111 RepID=A0AAU0F8E8_9FLAO